MDVHASAGGNRVRNVASWIGDQYSQSGSPVDPPWCLPSFRRQATRHSGYACPNRAAHVRLHGALPWLPADDPPLSGSVAWLRRPQREIVGPHRAPAPLLGEAAPPLPVPWSLVVDHVGRIPRRTPPHRQLERLHCDLIFHKFCQPKSAKQGPSVASENFMSL